MNFFRLNFPDCAKGEKIVSVSDWTQYNFVFVSERKMVGKVEQGGERGGMGRNEEVRTTCDVCKIIFTWKWYLNVHIL